MKALLQILLIAIIASIPYGKSSVVFAQIPNAGFEAWTDNNPDGWNTLDLMWDAVSQSNDAHSGSRAAKLEIIDYSGTVMPPMLDVMIGITSKPRALTGYYKFAPVNVNSLLSISVIFFKDNIINSFGVGSWETNVAAGSYTPFSIPIDFFQSGVHDSAWIIITVDDTSETEVIGAYAMIDDIGFDGATSVEIADNNIPSEFSLKQNFPNPFNPSTKIEYLIAEESFVDMKVYDILGKEVETLVSDVYSPGTYRADFTGENLPSGIYIAKLNAVSVKNNTALTRSIKMNLIK